MDWTEQYQAARQTLAFGWIPRDEISMEGSDAVAVLHKLCSNNIESLAEGDGCEAFVCTVQGKTVSHITAYRTSRGLRLVTVGGQAANLIAHLDRYVIREDVKFQHLENLCSLYVLGPRAADRLQELTAPCPASAPKTEPWTSDDGTILVRRLTDLTGFQLVGEQEQLETVVVKPLAQLDAVELSEPAWEALRIESFLPEYGRDITDRNLPQEVARDEAAISFTKGCYLGQETVARIDAMGHVNWLLTGVTLPNEQSPPHGMALQSDGKDVGRVTSACYSPQLESTLAFAYVRRQHASAGSVLSSELGDATVVSLPLPPPAV